MSPQCPRPCRCAGRAKRGRLPGLAWGGPPSVASFPSSPPLNLLGPVVYVCVYVCVWGGGGGILWGGGGGAPGWGPGNSYGKGPE